MFLRRDDDAGRGHLASHLLSNEEGRLVGDGLDAVEDGPVLAR
jgi:hypothetical protein